MCARRTPPAGDIEGERGHVKSDPGGRTVPILDVLAGELADHGLRTQRGGGDLVFGREAWQAFDPSKCAWER